MAMKSSGKRHSHAVYIGGDSRNVDLILGKVYRVIRPERLDSEQDVRIVDESGEDYLYPGRWFVPIDVPPRVKRALAAASQP
jgi:hypothetical protein